MDGNLGIRSGELSGDVRRNVLRNTANPSEIPPTRMAAPKFLSSLTSFDRRWAGMICKKAN